MDDLEQALRRLADEPLAMPGAARIEAQLLERFDRRARFPWIAAIGLALFFRPPAVAAAESKARAEAVVGA